MSSTNYQQILDYWFSDTIKKKWFNSNKQLDEEILLKFENIWQRAAKGKLNNWQNTIQGTLALIIILDQFPLNMFRNTAQSFATEKQAIAIVLNAIKNNTYLSLSKEQLSFFFMPLMHSENIIEQELSVKLYTENKLDKNIEFAKHHRDIIKKFARFPHRNLMLNRANTPAEIIYLNSADTFKG